MIYNVLPCRARSVYYAWIEPATSCILGEYKSDYAKSVVYVNVEGWKGSDPKRRTDPVGYERD
jgi:hypothetical protein